MATEGNLPSSLTGAGVPPGRVQDFALPSLSVIVPVYNGAACLPRCLEGLRLSEYRNFEIIVVDDRSTDSTPEIIRRSGVRSLRTPRPLGPAGARNMGIGLAQGSIVVFVDADVVLPPNALGLIAQEFARDAQLAAVFGSYDEEPSSADFLSQYKNLTHCYVHQNSSEQATTFWAGCGAVRKSIFVECGGFDATRYRRPSIEDIELGYRLVRDGHKIRLLKRLRVKHLKKWTLPGLLETDIFHRAVPWTRLILESRRLPRDLNLTSGARVSAGLVGLLSLGWVILFLQAANVLPTISFPSPGLAEIAVVAALGGALVALNWDMYAFFGKQRGWWFAARVVPMHWFYYLYSGIAFALCGVAHAAHLLVASITPAGRLGSPPLSDGGKSRS